MTVAIKCHYKISDSNSKEAKTLFNSCFKNFTIKNWDNILNLFGLTLEIFGFLFIVLEKLTIQKYERYKNFDLSLFVNEQFRNQFWLIVSGLFIQILVILIKLFKAYLQF